MQVSKTVYPADVNDFRRITAVYIILNESWSYSVDQRQNIQMTSGDSRISTMMLYSCLCRDSSHIVKNKTLLLRTSAESFNYSMYLYIIHRECPVLSCRATISVNILIVISIDARVLSRRIRPSCSIKLIACLYIVSLVFRLYDRPANISSILYDRTYTD